MNLLEGSIAFALALAGLATLCTVLIEILHRLFGLRAEGLRIMLDAYFEDVLKSRLPAQDVARLKANLLGKLTQSSLIKQLGDGWSWMPKFVRQRLLQADSLSAQDFLRRLPDSDVFKHLKEQAGDQAEQMRKELGEKYEQYGAAASDYFKHRAQLLSILAGLALALFGNIHAGRIFDAFVKNPELAQRMEAQADDIRAALEKQTQVVAQPAAKPAAGAEDTLKRIVADVESTKASLQRYQEMGLPIGWAYYPNCFEQSGHDPHCGKALNHARERNAVAGANADLRSSLLLTACHDVTGFLLWLFTVVLTGVLIGLGGPFWYDLAMRLSQVKQAIAGKPAGQAEAEQVPAPATPQGKQPWDDKPW
jgi:hypothetical protein